jgi:hypothetical protein
VGRLGPETLPSVEFLVALKNPATTPTQYAPVTMGQPRFKGSTMALGNKLLPMGYPEPPDVTQEQVWPNLRKVT